MIEFEKEERPLASIHVIGVGGAGGNTINSMVEAGFKDINFIAANTDAQALKESLANETIQLGVKSTKGLGAGANPEIGRRAAEEDLEKIIETSKDADIVFITAGMGGGTGSGASTVIAKALKERGVLTVAIVTKPFMFEGRRRTSIAEESIAGLREEVDTLIILPNQKLIEIAGKDVSMMDAFSMINAVLSNSVKGISDIITRPGHINVDFADLRAIMQNQGVAVMGTGRATGEDRAKNAALDAITSPLLENMNVEGAQSVLLNITGGKNLGLHEIHEAASIIYEQADDNANIIIGSVIDENLTDELHVTIVATGFQEHQLELKDVTPVDEIKPAKKEIRSAVLDRPEEAVEIEASEEIIKHAKKQLEKSDDNSNKNDLPATSQDLDVPTYLRQQ
jgi:cell division protein FtsZ